MIEKLHKGLNITKLAVEALNRPEGEIWDLFDGPQQYSISNIIKVASALKDGDTDLNGFDITAAIKEHPDKLFVKMFAIEKDEVNDNGDAFNEEELRKGAETFIGVPLFCNHANDDIEKARGKVVHAWYDEDKGGIFIIGYVDAVAYPKLARGIKEGYVIGTSMGTQVKFSSCSICHNYAATSEDYCTHVKNQKTKQFSGKIKCAFHKSKNKPKDMAKCPVCNCEESKELVHKDAKVFEWNYGLKFIENSFVVNPACHRCGVECILNVPEYNKKVAHIQQKMLKIAKDKSAEQLVKIAGKAELDMLNKAMKFMEVVAKSMMDQKDQVSMEYVSDIVDVLANTQTVTDELMEMGYGQLSSPATLQDPNALGDAVPLGTNQGQQTAPENMQPSQQPQPQMGATTIPNNSGIGSVTKPTVASKNKKEFDKFGSNLQHRLASLSEIVGRYTELAKDKVYEYSLSRNGITVNANRQNEGVDLHVLIGDKNVESVKKAHYEQNSELFWNSPDNSALEIISEIEKIAETLTNNVKESVNNMSNNEKTAAGSGLKQEALQVTTEKQLANANLEDWAGQRQGKEINTVTEGSEQLGGSGAPNDTTTDSPQQRKGEYANYTTELQLDDLTEAEVQRWNSYPTVITEKQWEEFNRSVGAILSEDQHNHVTQSQLEDLRKNHRWTDPNYTTENQLASGDNWLSTDNAWLSKEASVNYAKALVTASMNALSDTVALYKRTPAEIVKAAKYITSDPNSQLKAAFITLINGMPNKLAKRKAALARSAYFNSDTKLSAVDALLACMGDHCKNLKAEEFVDTIAKIASSQEKMAIVEKTAQQKLASAISFPEDNIVDKSAALEDAFNSLFKADSSVTSKTASENSENIDDNEDGLYQVNSTIAEISADINDHYLFSKAAEKFAQAQVAHLVSDAVLYSIDVDEDTKQVITTLKSASKLTEDEAVNYEKFASQQRINTRENLLKEAQMMGGDMGGMGGPTGGQGATMPAPPGGAQPPAQPPAESMDSSTEDVLDEDGAGEDGGESPLPPGSLCPVCGTKDVDVVAGKGKCNNPECGSEFIFKVQIEVTKFKGVTDTGEEEGGDGANDGAPLDGDAGTQDGEGFAMPDATETPNMPVAAMTRINPNIVEKFAANGKFGNISPLTGSNNTHFLGAGTDKEGFPFDSYLCLDTGTNYSVHTRINKNSPKDAYVEWRWLPKVAGRDCPTCTRARNAWTQALKAHGLTDDAFDSMPLDGWAETVLAMKDKGLFSIVKTASSTGNVVSEYKKAFKVAGKFPYESCIQKISNRYGENAVALSGPNKGQNLAECVCNQLKSAKVYNDRMALKIADTWKDRDACLNCIEDVVRLGYEMEKAASICQHLKVKFASNDELFAEAMGEPMPAPAPQAPAQAAPSGGGGMGGSPLDNFDPFAPSESNDTMDSMDAPGGSSPDFTVDVHPQGDEQMEVELGGDSLGDLSVTPNNDGGQSISIELPVDAVKALDVALQTVMHGSLGGEDLLPGGDPEGNSDEIVEFEQTDDSSGDTDDSGESENSDSEDGGESDGSDAMGFGDGESEDTDNTEFKEPEVSDNNETEFKDEDRFAQYMRKGKTNRVGEINLDVSLIQAALKKQAGEVTPTQESSQDVVDGYTAGDGSTQGNEEKFDADLPSVPRNNATIGNEPSDLNPNDKPLPSVPKGGSEANLEGEENYKAESGVNLSGGTNGAGKTQTAKNKGQKKVADKKVTVLAPQDATEVSYSNNKDHSNTPEKLKRTPFADGDKKEIKNVPEKGEGAFIGDEKTSIDFVPKTENSAPEIPSDGKLMSKEKNEKNKPEMVEKVKGFVAAKSEKSKAIEAEANLIAGRMLKEKLIDETQLQNKIAELTRYDLPQLKDIENAIFKAAKKGFATEPDGEAQPVPIISAASNERSVDLTSTLRSMFTLGQRNEIADQMTDANLRKTHGR